MRITVLGLGRMGTPMAHNLAEVGHEVTVYNRTAARVLDHPALPGTRLAATVAGAVCDAQVALTMVSDDQAEDALTFGPGGLLESLPAGAIHLCMSSIGVEASRRLAAAHGRAGQGYVAAPVLGNPGAAQSRHLWILAAGPEIQVVRCQPIFQALGRGTTQLGAQAELAHALKLGASAMTVALVETLAEVLAYGEKAGCPPAEYSRLLNLGLFRSPLLDAFGGLMVRHDHEPSDQTLDLAAKDLLLLVQSGRELRATLPMAGLLYQQVQDAQARGLGSRDLTALATVCRQEAALDLPPRPEPVVPQPEGPRPGPEPAHPPPSPPPPAATSSAARAGQSLDLQRTSHFEADGATIWAWVDGTRQATPWQDLAEVERALNEVELVRVQGRCLVNPQAVQELKPRFGGRTRVLLAGGQTVLAGRVAAQRLRFLLGW